MKFAAIKPLAALTLLLPSALDSLAAPGDSQYWHEKYHGLLSMAAYGDYATTCASFFTQESLQQNFPSSVEAPFTILERFGPTQMGLEGFTVQVPEMDKVVVVFKGIYGWESFNHTSININQQFNLGCSDCQAHAGAVQAYTEAQQATNNFAVATQTAETTGHEFSITGHGFGGMVGLIMALDMGWQGITHWSHAHGTPRTFNPASADLYASLYGGEAGQHVVANNDPVPDFIPESDDYVHPLSGLYIWGTNSTYGMNWRTCFQDAEDPACQGDASAPLDHYYYYTPVGQCGQRPYYTQNDTIASAFVDSQSQSYYATATASIPSNFDDDDEQTSTSTATSTSASTSADENNEDSSALVAAEASQHQGNDDSSASPLHLAFSSIATALIVLSVTNF